MVARFPQTLCTVLPKWTFFPILTHCGSGVQLGLTLLITLGKDNNNQGTNLEQVVKTEQPEINNVIHATSFGGLAVAGTGGGVVVGADVGADEQVVVDLQHFVSTTAVPHAPPSVVATTATQMILVRSRCSLKNCSSQCAKIHTMS